MGADDELGKTVRSAQPSTRNDKELSSLPAEAPGRYAPDARELGRGGMGRVLEVRDVALDRAVAIKELLPEASGAPARFLREARLTAQLEHPGVVPVYELGQRPDGAPYYAMRKVQGRTLADALAAGATLDDRLALLPHLLDAAWTVAYSHGKGILHRDLKPENVMVGPFGETLVLDWGLARRQGVPEAEARGAPASPDASPALSQDGQSVGTPSYMSPEQACGELATLDARTDVWSLGVMLYELLAGRVPFVGDNLAQVLHRVVTAAPPPLARLEPRVPRALVRVAERALQKDPSARYPSALELARDLEAATRARVDLAQRPRGWMAASLGLALGCMALLAWGLWRASEADAVGAAAARGLADARAEADHARAERAQAAFDSGDVAGAAALAAQVLEGRDEPLAAGVRALAEAAGAPERAWSVGTEAGCAALAVRGGEVACATLGGVLVLDAADGRELRRVRGGPGLWQRALASAPGDAAWLYGGDDRAVRSAAGSGEALEGLPDGVRALAASADGAFAAAGLRDGRVLAWARPGGAPKELARLRGAVHGLAFARTGQLAASSDEALLVLKGAQDPAVELSLDRGAGPLAFLEGWPLLAPVGRTVFALAPQAKPHAFSGARHDVTALLVQGPRVVAASADGALHAWSREGTPVATLPGFAPGHLALAGEPARRAGGPDVFVAAGDRSVQAWRWPLDRRGQPPAELGGEATSWQVDAEGHWWAGRRDGHLAAVEPGAATGEPLHARPVRALAAVHAAAGPAVLSAGDDGAVWLLAAGARTALAPASGRRPLAVALSADAAQAAWSLEDGTLVLHSVRFGREVARLRAAPALALAFSPDGRALAAGREDKRVALLGTEGLAEQRVLEGADGRVRALAFAPKGDLLASGGDDRRVTLWTLPEGRPLGVLTGPLRGVGALAFSKDGAAVAAGSDEGTWWAWDVGRRALRLEARARSGDARALGPGAEAGAWVAVGSDGVPRTLRQRPDRSSR